MKIEKAPAGQEADALETKKKSRVDYTLLVDLQTLNKALCDESKSGVTGFLAPM